MSDVKEMDLWGALESLLDANKKFIERGKRLEEEILTGVNSEFTAEKAREIVDLYNQASLAIGVISKMFPAFVKTFATGLLTAAQLEEAVPDLFKDAVLDKGILVSLMNYKDTPPDPELKDLNTDEKSEDEQ